MQLAPQAVPGTCGQHVCMAYTKEDLITIERAIASGSRRVRLLSDMERASGTATRFALMH